MPSQNFRGLAILTAVSLGSAHIVASMPEKFFGSSKRGSIRLMAEGESAPQQRPEIPGSGHELTGSDQMRMHPEEPTPLPEHLLPSVSESESNLSIEKARGIPPSPATETPAPPAETFVHLRYGPEEDPSSLSYTYMSSSKFATVFRPDFVRNYAMEMMRSASNQYQSLGLRSFMGEFSIGPTLSWEIFVGRLTPHLLGIPPRYPLKFPQLNRHWMVPLSFGRRAKDKRKLREVDPDWIHLEPNPQLNQPELRNAIEDLSLNQRSDVVRT